MCALFESLTTAYTFWGDRVSWCSLSWPQICDLLPQLPECRNYSHVPQAQFNHYTLEDEIWSLQDFRSSTNVISMEIIKIKFICICVRCSQSGMILQCTETFWLSELRMGYCWHLGVKTTAKHPTINETVPQSKEFSSQNIISVKVQKPWFIHTYAHKFRWYKMRNNMKMHWLENGLKHSSTGSSLLWTANLRCCAEIGFIFIFTYLYLSYLWPGF
jgi:hypothetical protein